MKTLLTITTFLALLLLGLYFDLVICGIAYPEKMDIICTYRIPVIGTTAKALALKANAEK